MSKSKIYYCIVDDTALITNISEIEAWVLRGAIALVVPLHTLERLHLLKKDTSQIGQNARKAVKFLDEATSNTDVKVLIQEPDDQYQTWAQVEAHYTEAGAAKYEPKENVDIVGDIAQERSIRRSKKNFEIQNGTKESSSAEHLTQMVVDKLTVSKEANTSPTSTPPLSPSSSGPQSSKTSPEVKTATMIANDLSPVPPSLKGLINPVVWYTYEKSNAYKQIIFLTNSSDTAYLARDFGVVSKNIHQLRAAIGVEELEAKNHNKYHQKKNGTPIASKPSSEPKTLFRYEEEESEEEEVVFKPRRHGSNKGTTSIRGGNSGSVRSKGAGHSPANSLSGPSPVVAQPKPQIPTEEIDPDSFDRGSFARGNTPLVSVGNHTGSHSSTPIRGPTHRGNFTAGGSSRGSFQRGSPRGVDRGSGRGRGRLFVP